MMKDRLLQRVDELIEMGNAVLGTRHCISGIADQTWADPRHGRRSGPQPSGPELVDDGKMREFRTASLSFMQRVYGEKHPYYLEFLKAAAASAADDVECGLGILRAIQGEIAGGWLFTVKSLVTAEVFADFIEMAEYLSAEGYKDPAAVIIGSVLEQHLRQLCQKHGIPITRQKDGKDVPLKADALNSELAKAEVYNKLDQKQVTAWLDLRNNAAHGKYEEYEADRVKIMITGISEFMTRVAV